MVCHGCEGDYSRSNWNFGKMCFEEGGKQEKIPQSKRRTWPSTQNLLWLVTHSSSRIWQVGIQIFLWGWFILAQARNSEIKLTQNSNHFLKKWVSKEHPDTHLYGSWLKWNLEYMVSWRRALYTQLFQEGWNGRAAFLRISLVIWELWEKLQ